MRIRYTVSIVTAAAALSAVLLLAPVAADGQAKADAKAKAKAKGAPFPWQLTLFDRQGKVLLTMGEPGAGYNQPVFSPDGGRLAVGKNGDIVVLDLSTGAETKIASTPAY